MPATKPDAALVAKARSDANAALSETGEDPVSDVEQSYFDGIGELTSAPDVRLYRFCVDVLGAPPDQLQKVPDPDRPGQFLYQARPVVIDPPPADAAVVVP